MYICNMYGMKRIISTQEFSSFTVPPGRCILSRRLSRSGLGAARPDGEHTAARRRLLWRGSPTAEGGRRRAKGRPGSSKGGSGGSSRTKGGGSRSRRRCTERIGVGCRGCGRPKLENTARSGRLWLAGGCTKVKSRVGRLLRLGGSCGASKLKDSACGGWGRCYAVVVGCCPKLESRLRGGGRGERKCARARGCGTWSRGRRLGGRASKREGRGYTGGFGRVGFAERKHSRRRCCVGRIACPKHVGLARLLCPKRWRGLSRSCGGAASKGRRSCCCRLGAARPKGRRSCGGGRTAKGGTSKHRASSASCVSSI